jgi:hypothetical protein
MDKNVLVLWSGGYDSTFLIQHLLESDSKTSVWAAHTVILNNVDKSEMEMRAIKVMDDKFRARYNSPEKERFTFWSPPFNHFDIRGGSKLALGQAPIWLMSALYYLTGHFHEIALGYVMNDCALSYTDDYLKIWESYRGLIKQDELFPRLTFPLAKWPKWMIHEQLWPEFYHECVYCEHPTKIEGTDLFSVCNCCSPCESNAKARSIAFRTTEDYQI